MKNKLMKLLQCAALICAIIIPVALVTGCANTSPSQTASKSAGVVITTADQAIAAWADHVVSQKKVIASMSDPIAKADAQHTLLVNEGRVDEAYASYQKATRAAVMLGSTSSNGGGVAEVSAAVASLIAVVTQLIH